MKRIILASIVLFFAFMLNSYAQTCVIVNKDVDVTSIDKNTIKRIFQLQEKRLGGTVLTVFDNGGAASGKFYGAIGITYEDIKKEWLKAKLTGKGNPPDKLGSDDDVVSKVGSTSGGIGYVNKSSVKGNVKIVLEM